VRPVTSRHHNAAIQSNGATDATHLWRKPYLLPLEQNEGTPAPGAQFVSCLSVVRVPGPAVCGSAMTAGLITDSAVQDGTAKLSRRRRPQTLWALPFLVPAGAFICFIVLIPAVQAGAYAFTNWDGLTNDWKFTGLSNFERMLGDPLARSAVAHTVLLTLVTAAGINVFGVLLALVLNSKIKTKGLMRVVFFAPVIVTPVVVATLWKFIYQPDGPLNTLLNAVGLQNLTRAWLGDDAVALGAVTITIMWQFTGVAMVIYLAGLQNVPDELIEAAHLDGAGPFRRFFSIILPELRPAATIAIMLTLLAGVKTFDQVWIMTAGGPGDSTHTLSTAQYQATFVFGDFSYGAAFAVVISVIAIALAVVQQWVVRKKEA